MVRQAHRIPGRRGHGDQGLQGRRGRRLPRGQGGHLSGKLGLLAANPLLRTTLNHHVKKGVLYHVLYHRWRKYHVIGNPLLCTTLNHLVKRGVLCHVLYHGWRKYHLVAKTVAAMVLRWCRSRRRRLTRSRAWRCGGAWCSGQAPWYASRAAQFNPDGGQFDFVWPPTRTMRHTPMGRACGEPNEAKKSTHPKYTTVLARWQVCELPSIIQWLHNARCVQVRSSPNLAPLVQCRSSA